MILTHSLLHSAGTKGMGFNVQQLLLLGISWPPKHGWLRSLVGKEISDEDWQLVMKLKSVRRKRERSQIVNSHKQTTLTEYRQTRGDELYMKHAANVLPDLLKACQEFRDTRMDVPWNCKAMTDAADNLCAAIKRAEEIEAKG